MCFLSIFGEIGGIPMLMFLILLIRFLRHFDFQNDDHDDGDLPELSEVVQSEPESSEDEDFPTMHRVRRSRYVYGDYHPRLLYGISKKPINYRLICVILLCLPNVKREIMFLNYLFQDVKLQHRSRRESRKIKNEHTREECGILRTEL